MILKNLNLADIRLQKYVLLVIEKLTWHSRVFSVIFIDIVGITTMAITLEWESQHGVAGIQIIYSHQKERES